MEALGLDEAILPPYRNLVRAHAEGVRVARCPGGGTSVASELGGRFRGKKR